MTVLFVCGTKEEKRVTDDPVLTLIAQGIRYHARREEVGEPAEGQRWSVFGHYVSDDPDLQLLAQFLEAEVPVHEAALLNHLSRYGVNAKAIPTIALLGWGKNYPAITMALRSFLGGTCHEIHAMAARTLHPLIATDKIPLGHVGVSQLFNLVEHPDDQCAFRAMRIFARSSSLFAQEEQNFLSARKTVFQKLHSETRHEGVRELARELVIRILNGFNDAS